MRVPILTFAEYAAISDDSKLTIAGTIDSVTIHRKPGVSKEQIGPVPLPMIYLVAVFEASISDGLEHTLRLVIQDEDQHEVAAGLEEGRFTFAMNKYGRPMRSQLIMRLHGLTLPGPGDYEFQVIVDGQRRASAALYLVDGTPNEE